MWMIRGAILAALGCGAGGVVLAQEDSKRPGGAPIAYDTYTGTATVISIEKPVYAPETPSYQRHDGFEVKFTFKPDEEAKTDLAKMAFQRSWMIVWEGGSAPVYPSADYIRQHKIAVGCTAKGIFQVITSGTATPICYQFEAFPRE